MNLEGQKLLMPKKDIHDAAAEYFDNIWNTVLHEYSVPMAQYLFGMTYTAITRFTLYNMFMFILKYVPTFLYMYKFIKDVYITSRQRIRQKELEIEEIEIQIQTAQSKLSLRVAEFGQHAEQLREGAERLRKVRTRVRDIIVADHEIRQTLEDAVQWDTAHDIHLSSALKDDDNEFIANLLQDLKCQRFLESDQVETKGCEERAMTDPNTPEDSIYSSLSDVDVRPDCKVKIVKVTNVYKIAYLKHYIKQKKVRKAHKQALLNKKIESIKTLLEDWQKTLNMVINNKLTILNIDSHPIDLASQAAMGDYSKPRASDSDSDIRNSSWSDMCYDEYNQSWTDDSFKPNVYSYEDYGENNKDCYDNQEYCDVYYTQPLRCECDGHVMDAIVEETKSQMAIEEKKSESKYDEWRDHMTM